MKLKDKVLLFIDLEGLSIKELKDKDYMTNKVEIWIDLDMISKEDKNKVLDIIEAFILSK